MASPLQRERATDPTCEAALSRLTPEDRAGQLESMLLTEASVVDCQIHYRPASFG
jgi:hypothetical protein